MAEPPPESAPALARLALALSKAQAEMRNPIKDKENPHYKSRYADLGSVRDAVMPALAKYGLAVTQTVDRVGDADVLVTTLLHERGGSVQSRYPIRPVKGDPQGFGSAVTYARRYSLSALVCVAADDDDDGEAGSAPQRSQPAQQRPAKQMPAHDAAPAPAKEGIPAEYAAKVKLLLGQAAKALGGTVEEEVQSVLNHYDAAELGNLTRDQADKVVRWANKQITGGGGKA